MITACGILGEGSLLGNALPGDGLGGTHINALSAGDTFCVAYLLYVHLAFVYAKIAIGTLGGIHLHTEKGDAVEEAVKRAQRTEETAEQAEHENTSHAKAYKQKELPCEQRPKHGEIAFIQLVGKQADATLQRSCGTNILAEGRQRGILERIHNGNNEHKERKNNIF
jgi:hypothetical protein